MPGSSGSSSSRLVMTALVLVLAVAYALLVTDMGGPGPASPWACVDGSFQRSSNGDVCVPGH